MCIKGHTIISALFIALIIALCALALRLSPVYLLLLSALFGALFALRVGGADMPITISLLNSLSGVAGGIAGIAVGNPVLICMGGVVGASGLLLTQIMCKAINRSLPAIFVGRGAGNPSARRMTRTPRALRLTRNIRSKRPMRRSPRFLNRRKPKLLPKPRQ